MWVAAEQGENSEIKRRVVEDEPNVRVRFEEGGCVLAGDEEPGGAVERGADHERRREPGELVADARRFAVERDGAGEHAAERGLPRSELVLIAGESDLHGDWGAKAAGLLTTAGR